ICPKSEPTKSSSRVAVRPCTIISAAKINIGIASKTYDSTLLDNCCTKFDKSIPGAQRYTISNPLTNNTTLIEKFINNIKNSNVKIKHNLTTPSFHYSFESV